MPTRDSQMPATRLAPLPVRLLAYAVLVLIALGAIVVIDAHVMARQQPLARPADSATP